MEDGSSLIHFGREVCGNLDIATHREWIVTNGKGGFASGTVSGVLSRRYHGLLIAALRPPLGRTLLLTRIDETVQFDGSDYFLYCTRWSDGEIEPNGYQYMESFRLEGAIPVWTFALGDALLEKRIWMEPGANTTFINYRYIRPTAAISASATRPMQLSLRLLVNDRDYHALTRSAYGLPFRGEKIEGGLSLSLGVDGHRLYLLSESGEAEPDNGWSTGYFLNAEALRGQDAVEDHRVGGRWTVCLEPGQTFTLAASAELPLDWNGERAYARRLAYEQKLLENPALEKAPGWIRQLALAADQFIVGRASPQDPDGSTIIAGYPWFTDWGRDTMISLPGLTLTTGRPEIARRILLTYAAYTDRGMLPNRFPDAGEEPEYNTADAALWFFEAVRRYYAATRDDELLRLLFSTLKEIFHWHLRGTRFGIGADPVDGLLHAGGPGTQLTWMDVKIGGEVITPRVGKPVEINALWHNALCCLADFARCLGEDPVPYESAAVHTRAGFARFWNEKLGCCFDVIDGPNGADPALRPNQLLAVSLAYSPLSYDQSRSIVEVCARHLFGSYGLRSLAHGEPGYTGRYLGDQERRDRAYHQGTAWAWLVGPFVSAHLRVYRDPGLAMSFLEPFRHQLSDYGLGSIGEIFDGDPPYAPRGCIAQAWSVAEVLRAWHEVVTYKESL